MDAQVTFKEIKDFLQNFVQEREWGQFHTPKNVSMKIAIEAAELMEKFNWIESSASYDEVENNRQEIEDELADVMIVALMFANVTKIDVSQAIKTKMAQNAQKYPVEKAKGRSTKYTKL
ncbi:MAG: nucleotide pyrophosphohydrolase [bacterium]|nr:nucleotide pyrophosphohydrolase [bacterium]